LSIDHYQEKKRKGEKMVSKLEAGGSVEYVQNQGGRGERVTTSGGGGIFTGRKR